MNNNSTHQLEAEAALLAYQGYNYGDYLEWQQVGAVMDEATWDRGAKWRFCVVEAVATFISTHASWTGVKPENL